MIGCHKRKQLQVACVRTLPLPAFFARPQSVASACSHCDPQFFKVSTIEASLAQPATHLLL